MPFRDIKLGHVYLWRGDKVLVDAKDVTYYPAAPVAAVTAWTLPAGLPRDLDAFVEMKRAGIAQRVRLGADDLDLYQPPTHEDWLASQRDHAGTRGAG